MQDHLCQKNMWLPIVAATVTAGLHANLQLDAILCPVRLLACPAWHS